MVGAERAFVVASQVLMIHSIWGVYLQNLSIILYFLQITQTVYISWNYTCNCYGEKVR